MLSNRTCPQVSIGANQNHVVVYVDSTGNVGIGSAAPETKLQIDSGALLMYRDNVTNYKNVLHYRVNSPDQTGTMQIVMSKTWSDTMVNVTIKGYEYDSVAGGGGAWEVVVSGYNYAASTQWINSSAEIRGNAPFTKVRLAHNGTANVILLGDTSTDWDYPQVVVSEVIAGYSAQTGWGTGWSASIISSEASITNVNTPILNMGRFADGSAATPTLSFFGDTNTGIYRPGADTLGFTTGGTERARIDSSGNLVYSRVGIGAVGVYDPAKTQAVWSMGSSYILPADGGTTSYGSLYGLGWSYNPDYGGAGNNPQSKAGLNHQLLLMMNGVTYTALGNGIWTAGKITTTGGISSSGGGLASNYAGSGDIWLPYTDGNSYLRSPLNYVTNTIRAENGNWLIPNSGDAYFNQGEVGIGTASPSENLHVYGDTAGATSIMVDHGDSGADYTDADIQLVSRDSSNYRGLGLFMHNTNAQTEWFAGIPYANTDRYMIGRQASVATHDGSTAQTSNAFMVILNSGIVGIGQATPDEGKVEVKGGTVCVDTNSDNTASSCIANESDARLKKNIETLSASSSLATLLTLNPVSFDWRVDDPEVLSHYPLISRFASSTHSVGLIAQEVLEAYPLAMGTETVGDDEVQYYQLEYEKFIPLIISGVKELAIRVNTFGDNIATLSARVDELASAVTALSERISNGIVATGNVVSSGLSQFSSLWVGEIAVGTSEKPTGITLYDEVTGEPYCFKVREGQVATTLGVCSTVPTDEVMDNDADTEPPILIIMGNNPAEINVGDTYNDLGVTVTDNINPNVGYTVFVDGVEVTNIMLDTSVERTYEIEYRAEDQAGNVGSVTREVVVGNVAPEAEVPTGSSEETQSPVEEIPIVVEEEPPTNATTTPPVGE